MTHAHNADLATDRSTGPAAETRAWLDVSAGVAGDMLLGALVDAGADLVAVQSAVDAVVPDSVRLVTATVDRGGQRATKLDVEVLVDNPPHRTWASIRETLAGADLAPRTRDLAHDAFWRLAQAEGRVHGIDPESVHFHEVGALDSVADVVGVCEAVRLLGIASVTATPIALGSGRIRAAHGFIPVPVPAVTQLSLGWPVLAAPQGVAGDDSGNDGHDHSPDHSHSHDDDHSHSHAHDGTHGHSQGHAHDAGHDHAHGHSHDHSPVDPHRVGELATPTGVALVRTLAQRPTALPPLIPTAIGVGAGTKDTPTWPNVVRVVLGTPADVAVHAPAGSADASLSEHPEALDVVEIRANIDDLDPRVWPSVLDALLDAGALDAWLTPILMKKGRPAHVVTALAPIAGAGAVEDALLAHTPTLGVRRSAPLTRRVRERRVIPVEIPGADLTVGIKLGLSATIPAPGAAGRVITSATPEFEDVAALARAANVPLHLALRSAVAAAAENGLAPGEPFDGA